LRAGRARQHDRRLHIAAFIISQIIAIGGYYFSTELSYVLAFMLFIVLMFIRPQGIVRR